ncbi:glycosyltransferase family 4 protein [Candidatus Aerophobetes bacterium]|nr:glycosyltransferase family 4 protein [Candidatus Aerophobetes bacterium]
MMEDKNLLIISPHYVTFVKDQVEELARYLNEIYVTSPEPYGRNNLKDLANLPENVKVYFPKFFHLPINYFRRKLGDNFFRAALRVIKREELEFDLIHAHFTWPSGCASILLKRRFKVPVIVTAHGNDVRIPLTNYVQSFDNSFLKLRLDNVVNEADIILTHHEELRDLLLSSYPFLRSKIMFLYKGINLNRFNPFSENLQKKVSNLKKSLGIEDKFVVLFLARIDRDKDPLTFVEAAKLLRENSKIALVMVGNGRLRKKCLELKKKYGIDNLHIIGGRSDTEIWYAMADVFVALSPVENIWSTTLQEAFCMGSPPIVTDVGYSSKILKHMKDAFLIPPNNPKALVDAILKLKTNSNLRKQLSENALKWREKFDNKRIAKEITKIYQRIVLGD